MKGLHVANGALLSRRSNQTRPDRPFLFAAPRRPLMRLMTLCAATLVSASVAAQSPDITVTAGDLSAALAVGESTSRAVLVANGGDAPLSLRVRTLTDEAVPVVYAFDGGSGTLYGFDPLTGAVRSQVSAPAQGLLAFDGGTLYSLEGTSLTTYRAPTGEPIGSVTLATPEAYYYYPSEIAVSDGRLVVVAQSGSDFRLDVFDPASGALVRSVPLGVEARAVAAGDGVLYVSGYDLAAGDVLVTLDATTGERLRTAAFPAVRSLTFSRAAGALATLDAQGTSTVRLYNVQTGTFLSSFELPSAWGYGYYGSIAADEGGEAAWLAVTPRSRTISPGGQIGVTLTIDARRVVGGTYQADLVLSSNDPDEGEVILPVTLVATGAAQIAVTPEALRFGTTYAGTPVTRALTVRNPGSDTLRVSAVSVTDTRLAVAGSGFVLLPSDSLRLNVTLTPTGAGPLSAAVVFTTNVADAGAFEVSVTASDAFPPRLVVSASALAVEGEARAVATTSLTVSNEGTGPLTYSAYPGLTGTVIPARSRSGSRLASVEASAPQSGVSQAPAALAQARATARPSSGVEAPLLSVLATDAAEGGVPDLLAVRGAVGADTLYLAFDYAEIPDVVSVNVALDTDTDPHTGYTNGLLGQDAEISGYVYVDRYSGVRSGQVNAYRYDTGGYYGGPSFELEGHTFLIAVPLSALPAIDRAFDFTVSSYGESYLPYGSGHDSAPDEGIVAVGLTPWLSLAPETGTVAAGASRELAVSLDATDLLGGVYQGEIVVEGNGPEPQVARVPVTFTVIGTPLAEAAPLAFGSVFVGYASGQTLRILNPGTDDLRLESVESSAAALRASMPSAVVVRPGGVASVPVTVTASEVGAVDATLTFTTNAGPLVVAVTATAVSPPIAAVSGSGVSVDLGAGDVWSGAVAITNSGASPLTVRARVASPDLVSGVESPSSVDTGGGRERATAREAALARTGASRASSVGTALVADLPTLLVDPDEGRVNDLVEVRGQAFPDAGLLSLELVFARAIDVNALDGALYLDTDRSELTGYSPSILNGTGLFGTDLEVGLYGARYGEVYVWGTTPYLSRYVPVAVEGRSLRFSLPLTSVERAFDLVGFIYNGSDDALDVFPDAGAVSADARLGWLSLATSEVTVEAGGTFDLGVLISASNLEVGPHAARIQLLTNDPARPMIDVPVSLLVRAGVAGEDLAGPAAFELRAPAPNPTRAASRLAYSLPESADVVIDVFDAVGRRVATLDEGARPVGNHVAELDAASLPAGVYSIRLRAGSYVATQRFSVVR